MAKLSAQKRKSLKASSFGLPSKRKYPLTDQNHARLAIAMSAAHETPKVAKQVARRAVAKFPSINASILNKKKRRKK